jgi:hypothetical protein
MPVILQPEQPHPGFGEPSATAQIRDFPATLRGIWLLLQVDFAHPLIGQDTLILRSSVRTSCLKTGGRFVQLSAPEIQVAQHQVSVGETRMALDHVLQQIECFLLPAVLGERGRGSRLGAQIVGNRLGNVLFAFELSDEHALAGCVVLRRKG